MHEGSRMTSTLGKPQGLDDLNGTYFGISGRDITRSSARSFRAGQFNYTTADLTSELETVLAAGGNNASITDPFKEGVGWAGMYLSIFSNFFTPTHAST